MWRGGILSLAACSLLLGCPPRRPVGAPFFGHDVQLYVALTELAAKTDSGNVAAMVDAIEADFHEQGYAVTIVGARRGEPPPPVRLEVQVMSSASGDATVRGAGYLVGGFVGSAIALSEKGSMVVDAYVVRGGAWPPLYLGRFKANSLFVTTEESIASGQRTGHAVASAALRGDLPARARPLRDEDMR